MTSYNEQHFCEFSFKRNLKIGHSSNTDESRLVQHLKEMYSEVKVDTDAPNLKRVKFSDVQDELQKSFPSGTMSTFAVSQAITSAFPSSLRKKARKARQKYIYGVESRQLPAHLLNCCLHHTSLHLYHMNLRVHQVELQLCWHARRPNSN